MSLQASTEFKTLLLAAFPGIFNGGHIRVFDGPQPASADSAETGNLLGIITRDGVPVQAGGGIQLRQSGPYIMQGFQHVLAMQVFATGTAGWFRLVANPDDPGTSALIFPRLDGVVGLAGDNQELTLPSLDVTASDVVSPLSFFYTIPPVVG